MTQVNISPSFIKWVEAHFKIVIYAKFINGATSKLFHPTRTFIEECPLSPLLFLIITKGLSGFIKHGKYVNNIQGADVIEEIDTKHILFVDDIFHVP